MSDLRLVHTLEALALDQCSDAHEVRALILGERTEFGGSDGGELDGPHLRQYNKLAMRSKYSVGRLVGSSAP